MKILVTVCLCLLLQTTIMAQTAPLHTYANNNNAWLMYFGDHKISDKWGIHLEAQWRRNGFFTNPQQLLLRTGINYYFNAQAFATVGYCFVETYPYGGYPAKTSFPENRFWEQLQIKTQLNRFEWVSRFRLEQRFSKIPVLVAAAYEPGDAVYTNRFRLLNRFSLPFKGKAIVDKSFYISTYDEMLVNFGDNVAANTFDQNRAYIALGYKVPKLGRLEVGYMLQTIFKSDGIKVERNRTLQVGLTSTLDFYKKKNN
jgi:Protein of unknown function (DUF2490)